MELDEIDPAKWALLEDATREYIHTVAHKFDDVAIALSKVRDAWLAPPFGCCKLVTRMVFVLMVMIG